MRTKTQDLSIHEFKLGGIALSRPTPLPTPKPGFPIPDAIDQLIDGLAGKIKDTDNPEYEPSITAVHSKSRGIAQRILGVTTGREHHLLSRYERGVFLVGDFDSGIKNIREQFGLPVRLTQVLATLVGTKHPWHEGEPAMLTTDFLFTLKGTPPVYVAVDFKMVKDLTENAQKKLQLAALALSLAGVRHFTITEKDIPEQVVRNLRWLHIHRLPVDSPPLDEEALYRVEPHLRQILEDGKTEIYEAACQVARHSGISASTLSRACYWLAANTWAVDMNKPIGPDFPVQFTSGKN